MDIYTGFSRQVKGFLCCFLLTEQSELTLSSLSKVASIKCTTLVCQPMSASLVFLQNIIGAERKMIADKQTLSILFSRIRVFEFI